MTFALSHRTSLSSPLRAMVTYSFIRVLSSSINPYPSLLSATTTAAAATTTTSTYTGYQRRSFACQIRHPTKLGQLRAKFRKFGQGHIELDINHSTGLALLTLSNPSKHNALTGKMMAELADCVDFLEGAIRLNGNGSPNDSNHDQITGQQGWPQLDRDSGLVLKSAGKLISDNKLSQEHLETLQGLVGIIITGADQKSYCAGLDVSAAKTTLLTSQAGSEMSALMVSTLTRFMRLPILTVAAIEKAAIGGGAEMTTFCDHRCMTEKAKVQFVQTQMGVVTGWGGASRLIHIVSKSQALRMLAAAEPIRVRGKSNEDDSDRHDGDALVSGFAQCIAPVGKAVETATEYMQQYVWERRPPSTIATTGNGSGGGAASDDNSARRCVAAVRAMKEIVSFGLDHDQIERVSELEKDLFKRLWGGPDNLARVEATFSSKK
ncbi:enoyl CoA hydratase domain-containing protein 1 [Lobosporangium transversale]|uniref:ClpP/crotonase-like domain-containing protein n=1 Tax=Lobosporangium transversale TaxID=64571 RepID=A0A1Y2G8Z2_9FUNG|nr:ClpP/crotonase-like domain-containing protein [Lobosporangium transversale]KAF9916852.1 enoyl CoA hydratase domain-containing protein 1 [Lobosporangium transversale]ORZ04431.1 ClpP/crotonase-like domain-containing protein [Lobosporangium transversale]|eukprot:XP_021876539.1 ClpP/crotonase-like domain-containing protein [Lobosporangium transversale]